MHPDVLRRIALSRARQIANAAQQDADPCRPLYGIAPGAVLDHAEPQLFLAVTAISPDCMFALGIRQVEPWTPLHEVRMPADLLRFRLQRRWLKVVPDRRR